MKSKINTKINTRYKDLKVLILGSTGMVGSEVLSECIKNNDVKTIVTIDRFETEIKHKKLKQIICQDFNDLSKIKKHLVNYDICFYCIGVYQGSVSKEKFIDITYNLFTKLSSVVSNKKTVFCLFSAAGANSKSSILFAKWKGKCEDHLMNLDFKDRYILRPGYIHPSNPSKLYNSLNYKLFELIYPLIKGFSKYSITSNELAKIMVQVSINGYDKKILGNSDMRSFFKNE